MNESQTDEPPRRRKPYQWALLALGPIVLVVIITMLDVEALWNTLRSVDIGMFVLAGFILCSTVFIRTWRWRMLLADLTHEVPPYRDLVLIFAYATYVGVATPGRLGEFVKAFHLRSYGVSMGAATATVLTDRLLDIIVLLLVALTAVILVAVPGAQTSVVVPVIIVAVVASLVFAWWLLRSPALDRLVRAAARVEHPRLRGVLERLAEFGRDFRAAIRMQAVSTLGIAIVLTVIGWAVVYGANWLIAESIGLGLTYVQVVVVSARRAAPRDRAGGRHARCGRDRGACDLRRRPGRRGRAQHAVPREHPVRRLGLRAERVQRPRAIRTQTDERRRKLKGVSARLRLSQRSRASTLPRFVPSPSTAR